jgi:ABC-2 type transport system ATP-binding protein
MMAVIQVENVYKSFKNTTVLHGLSLTVEKGKVFGLLGPNGMGKSTLFYIICGLLQADKGKVNINNLDVNKHRKKIMRNAGIQLQESQFFDNLTVSEAIAYISDLYPKTIENKDEIIQLLELNSKKNTLICNLSGGQKQKLYLIMSLVHDPELIMLDEPTTGLDIQSRRNVWQIIRKEKSNKKTILLTTHYIEEAEALCDEIAFIDSGRIIAQNSVNGFLDSYRNLKVFELILNQGYVADKLNNIAGFVRSETINSTLIIYIENKKDFIEQLIVDIPDIFDLYVKDIVVRDPNLEDVYLNLTGKKFEKEY